MKRTELKRKTELKSTTTLKSNSTLKRTTRLAPVSKKRVGENALYNRNRGEFLMANPICQWPGCHCLARDVHHAKGRVGPLLWDKTHFRALCRAHHDRAHNEPLEAKRRGISLSRLEKEEET